MTMELIVAHGDVVTMNPSREVLLGGAVLVTDGVIAAVGSSAELLRSWPDAAVIGHSGHDQRAPAPDRRSPRAQLHP